MAGPLLETKFHLPTSHGRLVPRPRVSELIGRAAGATLTLVSAPAGFGKTTLIAELATRADGARVAWLSLEADDSDPADLLDLRARGPRSSGTGSWDAGPVDDVRFAGNG